MTTWADGSSSTRLASQLEGDARKTSSGSTLPTLPSNLYQVGTLFVRTSDLSLWRSSGTTWDPIVPQIDPSLTRQGLLAETFDRTVAANTSALATGNEYCTKVTLKPGTTVSRLSVLPTAVGTSLTLLKLGLRDKDGNRLAVSADEKATNNATGTRDFTMLSPYLVTSWDLYYLTALNTHTGTGISLMRSLSISNDTRRPGVNYGYVGLVAGQTDIQPGTATINFAATLMLPLWIGVS